MGWSFPRPTPKEMRTFFGGAALALVLSLVPSALQIAGIISMGLAHILIFSAWLISMVFIGLMEPRRYTVRFKVVSGIIVSVVLLVVDLWMVRKRAELDMASVLKGSLQFRKVEVPADYPSIDVGKRFGVNWHFVNPGPGRIFNVLSFHEAYVEEVSEQTDQKVKSLFEDDLMKHLAGKPEGYAVNIGEGAWNTVLTPPLTRQQYEGIFKGTTRLYFGSSRICVGDFGAC